ncbi:unnamed protein product [Boreogadus saida]
MLRRALLGAERRVCGPPTEEEVEDERVQLVVVYVTSTVNGKMEVEYALMTSGFQGSAFADGNENRM